MLAAGEYLREDFLVALFAALVDRVLFLAGELLPPVALFRVLLFLVPVSRRAAPFFAGETRFETAAFLAELALFFVVLFFAALDLFAAFFVAIFNLLGESDVEAVDGSCLYYAVPMFFGLFAKRLDAN